MKQFSIRENHLFRKTYKQGRKKGAATLVVYVLRDKSAALLKSKTHLKKSSTASVSQPQRKSEAQCREIGLNAS